MGFPKRALAGGVAVLTAVAGLAITSQPAHAITAPSNVWTKETGAIVESSPNVANIAGGLSVGVGSRNGMLYIKNAIDGNDRAGFPKDLGNPIDAAPAFGDVDFDGGTDIFAGSGYAGKEAGDLFRLSQNGDEIWKFHPRDNDFPNLSMFSSPALGDVNGDGFADVSGFSLGLLGWSFNVGGPLNKNWPFYQDDTIFSSPAIYDINGDGRQDYIVGGDSSAGPPVDHQGGLLRALNGNGTLIWEFKTDDIIRSSPAIGDVDGDGQVEIVFGAGYYYYDKTGHTNDAKSIFVLNKNGTLKWRKDLGGFTPSSPALADLNGDGRLDIVQTTWNGTSRSGIVDKTVFGLDGVSGAALPGWNGMHLDLGSSLGQPVTADFDNDGGQDVLLGSGGGLAAYSGKTGSQLFTINVGQSIAYQNSSWIGDVDGDNRLDIITAGTRAGTSTGVVQRWEMPDTTAKMGSNGWSQFRRDAAHSGAVSSASMGTNYCASVVGNGYMTVASDGGVFGFCSAFYGSMGGKPLNAPIVGASRRPDGSGYWLVASDGGIFAYGSAQFQGSMGGKPLNSPIVGMAPTPSGNGYWLVARDGGIFSFGDAQFQGSMGGKPLNSPIVGMASNNANNGYWLVASDGGIFAYGSAQFQGSMGGKSLNSPVIAMASTLSGNGYWLVARDGGIFSFGDAQFQGSMGGKPLNSPIVGMHAVASGYRLVAADGGIFSYGLPFYGSTGGFFINKPVMAIG